MILRVARAAGAILPPAPPPKSARHAGSAAAARLNAGFFATFSAAVAGHDLTEI
jgi:hypothetical protein